MVIADIARRDSKPKWQFIRMQSTLIYLRDGQVLIHSLSETTAGVWITSQPFIKLDAAATPSQIAMSLDSALNGSQRMVAHPTQWNDLSKPLLSLAGVSSWKKFMIGAACIMVERDKRGVVFTPHRNLGAVEGFEPLPELAMVLPGLRAPDEVARVIAEFGSREFE